MTGWLLLALCAGVVGWIIREVRWIERVQRLRGAIEGSGREMLQALEKGDEMTVRRKIRDLRAFARGAKW